MQLIAITVFIFAGLTVSSAQTDCSTFTTTSCCDEAECALAACGEAKVASCVNATKLGDVDDVDLCYNKTNECSDAPANTTAEPSTAPTTSPTVNPDVNITSPEAPATSPSASPSTPAEGTTHPNPTPDPTTAADPGTTPADATSTQNTPACDDGQTFDAASFVGGIVLAVGVIGIIFLGCKFFRAKSEQTYHQF